MDAQKVDLLIRYALGVAALKDPGARELGEIHILKFMYLADLAYAESNRGQTFTGIPWTFYKFGPWCQPAQARIRPVLASCGAIERTFTSPKFEGEGTRWHLDQEADTMVEQGEKSLPWVVQRAVKLAVQRFGDDTSDLLHHVYSTRPMLKAAPNDVLEFVAAEKSQQESVADPLPELTARQQKKQAEKVKEIQSALRARLATSRPRLVAPDPPPRYDEIFEAGVRALDTDVGEPLLAEAGELVFDATVWKSRGRSDPGIP